MAAMLAVGTSLKAQEVSITLIPGWTWISNPSTDTLDFATALGSFTPMTGDAIKSQWGNASYRNGHWAGSISQFYPGYGYHYYSTRTEPVTVTFNESQPTQQFVVTVSANPTEGGEVSGGGSYEAGAECTLTATANEGYTFTNWTENGNVISTNANYSFTVTYNRTLVANFTQVGNLNVYAWPVFGHDNITDLTQLSPEDITDKPHYTVNATQTDETYKVIVPEHMDLFYGLVRVIAAIPTNFTFNQPGGQGDHFFMTRSSTPTNGIGDYSWRTMNIGDVNYTIVQSNQVMVAQADKEFFFGKVSSSDSMNEVSGRALEIDISSMTGQ